MIEWCCSFCRNWNPINIDRCSNCGKMIKENLSEIKERKQK